MKTPIPYGTPLGIAPAHVGRLPGIRSFSELALIVDENRRLAAARAARRSTSRPKTVAECKRLLVPLKTWLRSRGY